MLLLVIVLLTGTEAYLNSQEIVAFLSAREADDPMKRYTAEVRCIVQMSNGDEWATREECSSIETRLHELRERQQP